MVHNLLLNHCSQRRKKTHFVQGIDPKNRHVTLENERTTVQRVSFEPRIPVNEYKTINDEDLAVFDSRIGDTGMSVTSKNASCSFAIGGDETRLKEEAPNNHILSSGCNEQDKFCSSIQDIERYEHIELNVICIKPGTKDALLPTFCHAEGRERRATSDYLEPVYRQHLPNPNGDRACVNEYCTINDNDLVFLDSCIGEHFSSNVSPLKVDGEETVVKQLNDGAYESLKTTRQRNMYECIRYSEQTYNNDI